MTTNPLVYSIAGDFPTSNFDSPALIQEVLASDAGVATIFVDERIDRNGDAVSIYFNTVPSAGQETIVDGVVAAHPGTPLASDDEDEALVAFEEANTYNFKSITYTSGLVTRVRVFSDQSLSNMIFQKDLTYDVSNFVTNVRLEDVRQSIVYNKALTYTAGLVTAVTTTKE